MLPVIYIPPYSDDTPTITPVLVTAVRTLAVFGVEWSTLTGLEPAPAYVKIATFIVAVLVLAVLEWRTWLRSRGRWYFGVSLTTLIVVYCAICLYAFFTFVEHPKTAVATVPGDPSIYTENARLKTELQKAQQDGSKWRFSYNLRNSAKAPNGERLACTFAFVLSDDQKAFTTWVALQPLLDLARWEITQTNVPDRSSLQFSGITILSGVDSGKAFTCATTLGKVIGETFPGNQVSLRVNQVTPALVACKNECVEIDIGN